MDLDLNNLYQDAVNKCSKEEKYGGYRLNFGVYFTPKF